MVAGSCHAGSGGLPLSLAEAACEVAAGPAVRGAALVALLELLDATATTPEGCDFADELAAHATATAAGILAELPSDEATDEWAEAEDEDTAEDAASVGRPGEAPEEALLEAALDAAGRLAGRGGAGAEGLRTAAAELLAREVWQARHAGLLILLRLACAAPQDEIAGRAAAAAALQHFAHLHPRVRWAALEVWARLLAAGLSAPVEFFQEALEALIVAAGEDHYVRVQRRGLLVLLLMTSRPELPLLPAERAEPLFCRVLLPHAASPAAEVRQACAGIAQGLAVAIGLADGERGSAMEGDAPKLFALWHELKEALERGAVAAMAGAGGVEDAEIEWPADWR
uniref:HEAT repeat-containing protein 1 n=1 Tax=Pyrodinium bahamense TaxID=73915 RepID=A0A6T9BVF2_9DINO